MRFDGVERSATVGDMLALLEQGVNGPNRHFDCIVWDLLGWRMKVGPDFTEWPFWQRGEHVRQGAVPEFTANLSHTLQLVVDSGECPKEFMRELSQVLLDDEDLDAADYVGVLPVAAITLWIMTRNQ